MTQRYTGSSAPVTGGRLGLAGLRLVWTRVHAQFASPQLPVLGEAGRGPCICTWRLMEPPQEGRQGPAGARFA